jgi:replication initiation protein RepC
MAESTLRRHLAALVKAGLIQRRDSPNGKRYAIRRRNGDTARAYGFDLSPLLYRAIEISQAACAAEEIAERMRDLRHDISLMKRDALMLLEQVTADNRSTEWESLQSNLLEVHKLTRRKLSLEQLEILRSNVETLLSSLRDASCETEKMDGSDSENERHYHNTNKDTFEPEPHDIGHQASVPTVSDTSTKKDPDIKIATVLAACPDIKPYHPDQIRNWADLLQAAQLVHSMMGISNELWEQAKSVMGPIQASVALAAILQRISKINNPGGYLRCLNRKAEAKQFSVTPMVMALLRNQS